MNGAPILQRNLSQSARENGWMDYAASAHGLMAPIPLSSDQLGFWGYCAERFGGPILDLCCGAGRYSHALAGQGHRVVGVDLHEGLLEIALRASGEPAADDRASFCQADIVSLDLGTTFRLAIMPSWSFGVLLTQEDQITFLQRLAKHLEPGGAFAFNLFIPFHRQQTLIEIEENYEWPVNPNYHSGALRTYDPLLQIETIHEPDRTPLRIRHTSLSELILILRAGGFEIHEMFGDDEDMRAFTGQADNDYTILARRS